MTADHRCFASTSAVVVRPLDSRRSTVVVELDRRPGRRTPVGRHEPDAPLKTATTPLFRQPVATSGVEVAAPNVTASSALAPQRGDTRCNRDKDTRGDHDERSGRAESTVRPTTARPPPCGPAPYASASGSGAKAPGRKIGLQVLPVSVLSDNGEKCSSWLGSVPTSTAPVVTPATSPPLSATPWGVTTVHRDDPGTAWSTCQNVFAWSDNCPIGRTAHDASVVSTEPAIGTPGAGLAAAGASASSGYAKVAQEMRPSAAQRSVAGPRGVRTLTN